MKSSIKIESFAIRDAMHPVIRVKISDDTSDLRDWTLRSFFQSLGHESNLLIVKYKDPIQDSTGHYAHIELLPVKDLLVDYFPDTKEAGIRVGNNTKELREFLDTKQFPELNKGLTYTNDGNNITVFGIQDMWRLATEYGRFLEKNGYPDPDAFEAPKCD
jgi:hypothetical protein